MKRRMIAVLCAATAVCLGADPAAPARMGWVTTIQTGLAETFQLTLGGLFGPGPAWQNKLETGLANVWQGGDYLFVLASDSKDLRNGHDNWLAGIGYRRPVWSRGRQHLSFTGGFQHWKFRGVKNGTNDWLSHENLTYKFAWKLPVTVTSDSWSLFQSPLAKGSLLHTQAWLEHRIARTESPRIVLRHGPAQTYAWGLYGTHGNRVMRYQSMVILAWKGTRLEGGLRKQWGMQPNIPDNTYWHFGVTRTVSK
ncbi:MAG TPA: hypothetical protein DEH78_18095 [Solibacterales bacterium]|nr:hypothetical protein [Bryobacterales bacterium]